MPHRILVATDGSTLSGKAVRAAVDLAGQTGADLVALHVVPRYPTSYFEGAVALEADEIGRVERQWAERGRAIANAAAAVAEKAGVQARATVAQSDDVAEAVVRAARKHRCDLIVMASHGRKGLSRVLLGSETQHVLAHSATPVLVIR